MSFLTDLPQPNHQPIAPTPKVEEAPVSQEIKSPTQSPVKVVPEQSPKPKVEANSAEKSLTSSAEKSVTSPEKKIMCRICSSSHLDENRLHIHLIMFHFKVHIYLQ